MARKRKRVKASAVVMQADQHRLQRGLLAMFEKVDYVFAGEEVRCSLGEHDDAPAWSISRTATDPAQVFFDPDKMGPLQTDDDWMAWLAANYHEVAHVIFSPNLVMASGHAARQYRTAFTNNFDPAIILEDARIESAMTALYPSMANYYRISFSRYCLGEGTNLAHSWILAHGRKFLDQDLVQGLRDVFETPRPGLIDEVAAVIDEYRVLDLSTQTGLREGTRLIEEMAKLWAELVEQSDREVPDHAKQLGGSCQVGYGDSSGSDKSQQASQDLKDDDKQSQSQGKGDSDSDQNEQNGNDSDDSQDGESGSGGDEGPSGNSQGSTGSNQDEEEENSGKGGKGAGGAKSTPNDLRQQLEEQLNEAQQGIVAQEVSNMQRRARGAQINRQHARYSQWMALDGVNDGIARGIATALERVRADADPGWDRHQPSGRLNVARAMQGGEIDTLFDEWNEGNTDATSIEWVLLLDGSSSMDEAESELGRCAWAVKRAADRVNINCTVIRYADPDDVQVVYNSTDRAAPAQQPFVRAYGNTYPFDALKEAHAVLHASKRKKRLLTVLTDGEWQDVPGSFGSPECDELIQAIGSLPGCVTSMAYLDPSGYRTPANINWHNCQQQITINSVNDLVMFARRVVTGLMKKR